MCPPPPMAANARMQVFTHGCGMYAQYTCHHNYAFEENGMTRTIVCLEGGNWSAVITGCKGMLFWNMCYYGDCLLWGSLQDVCLVFRFSHRVSSAGQLWRVTITGWSYAAPHVQWPWSQILQWSSSGIIRMHCKGNGRNPVWNPPWMYW